MVRGLGAEDGLEDGTTFGVERVASKLMIRRNLGGVESQSQKLVVSFAMDGSVRKLLGTWTSLDPASVRLPDGSVDEKGVVGRGLDEIAARQAVKNVMVDPTSTRPLKVGTYFEAEQPVDGVFGLRLRGFIEVPVIAPDGGWRYTAYAYDIF